MKHEDRRKEAGKMLMDVTKYLLTVGVIGSVLTEKVSYATSIAFFVIAIIVFLFGFYAIPEKKEGK
ncbi:MAG: hypothetical protein M1147_07365 [Nitrospirae bacterium]|nr:hypothetical protein [Nitrospirota bacterium]MCL5977930.1 hypothetical protein [Nitrospirota bacterium]